MRCNYDQIIYIDIEDRYRIGLSITTGDNVPDNLT